MNIYDLLQLFQFTLNKRRQIWMNYIIAVFSEAYFKL